MKLPKKKTKKTKRELVPVYNTPFHCSDKIVHLVGEISKEALLLYNKEFKFLTENQNFNVNSSKNINLDIYHSFSGPYTFLDNINLSNNVYIEIRRFHVLTGGSFENCFNSYVKSIQKLIFNIQHCKDQII
eukprot:UN25754